MFSHKTTPKQAILQRMQTNGKPSSNDSRGGASEKILQLQKTIGNKAVMQLMKAQQATTTSTQPVVQRVQITYRDQENEVTYETDGKDSYALFEKAKELDRAKQKEAAQQIRAIAISKKSEEDEQKKNDIHGQIDQLAQKVIAFVNMIKRAPGASEKEALMQKCEEIQKSLSSALDTQKIQWSRFNELKTINLIATKLNELVAVTKQQGVYEGTDLAKEMQWDPEKQKDLDGKRLQIQDALGVAETQINGIMKGASLRYRGSLASGWRNYTKSVDGQAQRIDLTKFDADAFLAMDTGVWDEWVEIGNIPLMKKNRKVSLDELKRLTDGRLSYYEKGYQQTKDGLGNLISDPEKIQTYKAKLKALLVQLEGLSAVEEQLKWAMSGVKGYKSEQRQSKVEKWVEDHSNSSGASDDRVLMKRIEETVEQKVGDFYFVIQSMRKTENQIKAKNPYDVGSLSKAGLVYTEMTLEHKNIVPDEEDESEVPSASEKKSRTFAFMDETQPNITEHRKSQVTPGKLIDDYWKKKKEQQ